MREEEYCVMHEIVNKHIDDSIGFRDKVIVCETNIDTLKSNVIHIFSYIDAMQIKISDLPKAIFIPVTIANVVSLSIAIGLILLISKQ